MDECKFVWPIITIMVVIISVIMYFFFPCTCTSLQEPQCAPILRTWETDIRIPNTAQPSLYSIYIHPDLTSDRFNGMVTISINVTQVIDHLRVNILDLHVSLTRLTTSQGVEVRLREAFEYSPNNFWVMLPEERVQSGMYLLYLEYSGSMEGNMVGLYTTTYTDPVTSETRKIASTMFEPISARRAFPCFDEPSFKAKFNISLVRPSGGNYIALSNMNQVKEEEDVPSKGLTTARFATSVPMSTYLACFIVCEFQRLPTTKTKRGLDVNVYARSGQIKKMEYAQKIAASAIDFFIDYFGIDYPLPKLDLIAIPDFLNGGMENWGLINFRETGVLYDAEFSSSNNKLKVIVTTIHELAHMWFGNLVTMKWWDDLWLNEGFATFMEFKGTHQIYPEWEIDTYFIMHDLTGALTLDSRLSSHSIVKHVSHPGQIEEIFDRISYAKGASVIRMLEGFMGAENFRQGVMSYLKTFQYKNADTKDLWSHMQLFSDGVNIPRVMDSWTRQMGYPVLTITQAGDTITVTQERFTADKLSLYDPNESQFKYKWDVPVTFFTSANKTGTLNWLLMEDPLLSLNIGNVEWYKLNYHFLGFYRVNYPPSHWAVLSKLLLNDITAVDAADRANLIDDAFSLAESGRLDYSVALSLTGFLTKENHSVVWGLSCRHLTAIDAHLQLTPVYSDYRKYLRKMISPHITKSLWEFSEDASYLQRSLQVKMISLGCKAGVPACLEKAIQLFDNWLNNNGTKPHVDIRSIVYNFGIAESGELHWDRLWDKYLAETDPHESARLRYALCAVREPWIIARLIERAKNKNYVRSQDYFKMLSSIAENPAGNGLLWDWFRANWQYLVDRFSINDRRLGRLLPTMTKRFSTEVKLKELETFIEEHPEAGAGASSRKAAVEAIRLNIAWLQKHIDAITEWLKTA